MCVVPFIRIRARTLILAGTDDPIIRNINQLAPSKLIPNARLELASGADHLPHLESPELAAKFVDEFLGTDSVATR